jgi:hypothetical protein
MDAAGGEQLSLAAVRDALVRLEDSVVFALIERARHPRNAPAYAPAAGGGGGAGWRSLVEFFVREAEALNAKASFFLFLSRLFCQFALLRFALTGLRTMWSGGGGQNHCFLKLLIRLHLSFFYCYNVVR